MKRLALLVAVLCTAQVGDALAAPPQFLVEPYDVTPRPLADDYLKIWRTPYRDLMIARRSRNRRRSQVAATGAAAWTNTTSWWGDGVDEIIERADEAALSCNVADEMTFCAWYHITETGATEALAAKWDYQTQGEWSSQVDTINATAYAYFASTPNGSAGNNVRTANGDMPAFRWLAVCVWYDGSGGSNADRARIYIDAVNESSSYAGTIPSEILDSSASMKIGQWGGTIDRPFPGRIDEPCMWCEALSTDDITAYYNSGTAIDCTTLGGTRIVALRNGDGDTHPTAINSGSAGDFTYVNGENSDLVLDVPGQNTHAFSPDGADEHLLCSDLSEWDGIDIFTISTWVFLGATPSNGQLMGKWQTATDDRTWTLFYDSTGKLNLFLKNGATGITSAKYDTSESGTLGTYVHNCWQVDLTQGTNANRVKYWRDSVLKALVHTGTHESTLQASTAKFSIAAYPDAANPLAARIDETAIFLSLYDCETAFNDGVPQKLDAYTTEPTHIWQIDGDTYPTATDTGSNPDSCAYTNTEDVDRERFTP